MISSAVSENNISIISLEVQGVYNVYLDFFETLLNYIETPYSKRGINKSSELLQQVYNKFDDVTSAVLKSQPKVLSLEDGSGIPFYCQMNVALVLAHYAMLSNKDNLSMPDDYFYSNRKAISEYIDSINGDVHGKTIGYLSSKFGNRYNEGNKFMRHLYLSGYSIYLSVIRKILSLYIPCEFQWKNSVEIYGVTYSESDDLIYNAVPRFGKDMNIRMSMLTRISSYSHIDAVIRIIQSYVNSNNDFIEYGYAACKGETGDSHDKIVQLECCDSGSEYFHPSKIIPIVRYISDAPRGSLNSIVLKTPTETVLSTGTGAWENKTNLNIPGYYFTAVCLANSSNGNGECKVNSGAWLKESGPIFRSLDGYIPTLLDIEPDTKRLIHPRSYEMDFNNGLNSFQSDEIIHCQADILVGKNCFMPEGGKELHFSIHADDLFGLHNENYELLVTFASGDNSVELNYKITSSSSGSYAIILEKIVMFDMQTKSLFNDTLPLLNYPGLERRIPFKTYSTGGQSTEISSPDAFNRLNVYLSFNKRVLISSVTLILL